MGLSSVAHRLIVGTVGLLITAALFMGVAFAPSTSSHTGASTPRQSLDEQRVTDMLSPVLGAEAFRVSLINGAEPRAYLLVDQDAAATFDHDLAANIMSNTLGLAPGVLDLSIQTASFAEAPGEPSWLMAGVLGFAALLCGGLALLPARRDAPAATPAPVTPLRPSLETTGTPEPNAITALQQEALERPAETAQLIRRWINADEGEQA